VPASTSDVPPRGQRDLELIAGDGIFENVAGLDVRGISR
jgi:hypothetical protein